MNELISVIVPVYNVEKYIHKCVDSIIGQTYKVLEIILIDDGSTDNSGKICDEYAKKDSRIRVIHKENGGLSDARNAGMKIAKGDYIFFIDSDDRIENLTIEAMYNAAKGNDADIVECNALYEYEGGKTEKYNNDQYAVYSDNNAIMDAYIRNYNIKTVVWNKLYKKTLIDGICFEYGKIHEDEFFTYKVLGKAHKLVHLENYYYYYFQREASIMGSYNLKRLDMIDALERRYRFILRNYPSLEICEKKTFGKSCLFHYQMLLKNTQIENKKTGKIKIKNYRKRFHICINELKEESLVDAISLWLSNWGFGLSFAAGIRNLVSYGL